MPGSNRLNGVPFTVRAAGYLTCAAGTYTSSATPIAFALFASNTASFAAATANGVFSLTAVAIFTVTNSAAVAMPWEIEVEMQGDNVSKVMGGAGQGFQATSPSTNTMLAQSRAVCATNLTTFNAANEPPAQFTVGIVTAASNGMTSPVATLTEFSLEA